MLDGAIVTFSLFSQTCLSPSPRCVAWAVASFSRGEQETAYMSADYLLATVKSQVDLNMILCLCGVASLEEPKLPDNRLSFHFPHLSCNQIRNKNHTDETRHRTQPPKIFEQYSWCCLPTTWSPLKSLSYFYSPGGMLCASASIRRCRTQSNIFS